jgi:WD40 repeat protein
VSAEVKSDRLLHRLFDREAPPDTEPMALRDRDTEGWIMGRDFDPSGLWLAAVHDKYGSLWAIHEKKPRVLRGLNPPFITALSFSPDGQYLVSGSYSGEIWRWSLIPTDDPRLRLFYDKDHWLGLYTPSFDREGRFAVVADVIGERVLLIPIDGGPVEAFDAPGDFVGPAVVRGDGRVIAVVLASLRVPSRILLRDLETGVERTLSADVEGESCAPGRPEAGTFFDLLFLPDGRLLTAGMSGLRVFDLSTGTNTRLRSCQPVMNVSSDGTTLALGPDARTLLIARVTDDTARTSDLAIFDLESLAERSVASHGIVTAATLDPAGRYIVSGSGMASSGQPPDESEEPHLLYGHTARVTSIAWSPDGKWIASAAEDGTIRLWPMPERRPLHTLPSEELVAKLRSLTNLRVVADAGSATGYKIEPGPFPGWAKFPEW